MNDVLKLYVSLSFSGTLLILFLLGCKPFLKSRFNRQWQYYIWLLVLARLLLPFAPDSNLAGRVFGAVEHAVVQSDTVKALSQAQVYLQNIDAVAAPVQLGEQENEPLRTVRISFIRNIIALLAENLWCIWLMVALLLLMYKITVYRSFVRYVKAGQSSVIKTRLLEKLAVISKQAGVKVPVALSINGMVTSPLLIGFFRPCIVLPDESIPEKNFQYTVLHELIHFRRRDMFYKWLVQIVVCLHWFNPLVHYMSREINRACEFSCDEAIVSQAGVYDARDYGQTLLDAMVSSKKCPTPMSSVTLSENKQLLRERLDAMMRFQKKSKPVTAFTVLFSLLLCCGAAYAGSYTGSINMVNTAQRLPATNKTTDDSIGLNGQSVKLSVTEYVSRTDSLIQNFARYQAFDVIYDVKQDAVFYHGEQVKLFVEFQSYPENLQSFAFQLCYQDEYSDSTCYLEAVRDQNGNITEIRPLDEEIADILLETMTAASQKDDIPQRNNRKKDDWHYIVMDGIQHIEKYGIIAKDMTRAKVAPDIQTWLAQCDQKEDIYLQTSKTAGGYITYIYYNGGGRYPWQIDADDERLVIHLFSDSSLVTEDGYFLMYYQAPKEYTNITIFLDDRKLYEKID